MFIGEQKTEQKVKILFTNLLFQSKGVQWPNLKNLSDGLNLSRGLNMVGSTLNCIKCLKI